MKTRESNEYASYLIVKDYLKANSINESSPELLDRISENGIICNVDEFIVEVELNDDSKLITYHQIYELVDKETSELWPINEDRYLEVFDKIERLADVWLIGLQRIYLNYILSDLF